MMEDGWVIGGWEEDPASAHLVCAVQHGATGTHGYAVISWRDLRLNCEPEQLERLKEIRITNAKRSLVERV